MRSILLATCLMVSSHCAARTDALAATLDWLQSWSPQNIEFKMVKSAIKFSGCKQKEYLAAMNQPLSENLVLEMGLGYAKGAHSWGVFNQRISVKELSIIPRYQLNHNLSVGFGVVSQSQTEFKTSQGIEFNLPSNTSWLIKSRADGFATNHYWELTASSQKWNVSSDLGGIFENGARDSKIALNYTGYF